MIDRVFLVALTIGAGLTQAQNFTSWVASNGNDSNSCLRNAPCLSFGGAIAKTKAGGEIHVVDGSDYSAMTISKSLTIDGGGLALIVTAAGINGIDVALASTDLVTIRNLTIYVTPPPNAAPTNCGISVTGGAVRIENVSIVMAPGANSDGICGGQMNLHNVNITGGSAGVVGNSSSVTADHLSVFDSSSSGLNVANGSLSVTDSIFRRIGAAAIVVSASQVPAQAMIVRCEMSGSGTGLFVANNGAAATARVSDSVITGNTTGVNAFTGGTIVSLRNNVLLGNVTDGTIAFSSSLK